VNRKTPTLSQRITQAGALVLGALALSVPLLGTWFGGGNRWLELLSGLRVQAAFLAIPAVALALHGRTMSTTIVVALAAGWNWGSILPWYFGRPREVETGVNRPFRATAFNVRLDNRDYQRTLEFTLSESPDLVAFLEAAREWPTRLGGLTTEFPHRHSAPDLQIEVFSRSPIRTAATHLVGEFRGYLELVLDHRGTEVIVLVAHAYPQLHFGQQGFAWRNDLLTRALPAAAERHRNRPLVLIGDLNATMWSPQFRTLERRSGLENSRRGFGVVPTCGRHVGTSPALAVPYDHCLVSHHWSVRDLHPGPPLGSDHLPLTADLDLRPHDPPR
jgi:endonuclease/exonuclease/phosphatase (EEP) superfamily protein YafD